MALGCADGTVLALSLSHGVPPVDDRRVLSGFMHAIRTGMRWRDMPPIYGPRKTLNNRFERWSHLGMFDRIVAAGAREFSSRRGCSGRPS